MICSAFTVLLDVNSYDKPDRATGIQNGKVASLKT